MKLSMFRAMLATALVFAISVVHAEDLQPGPLPGISGMAKLAEGAYLAVHDTKVTADAASEAPRMSLITFKSPQEIACETVDVDWNALKGGRTNDLESICEIVDKPGEFIAVESGYVDDDYARIIHLKSSYDSGEAHVSVLGCVRYLPTLPDGATFKDIEGAQTFKRGDTTYLLLTKRGHNEKKARLIWGVLDWDKPVFKVTEDFKVETPFAKKDVKGDKRYASDVIIVNNEIYISSCNDPGDDGPFDSAVYHVGAIRPDGQLIHLIDTEQVEMIAYKGHKVEALAPAYGDHGLWVAATDDENFKGTLFITSKP